MPTLTTVKDQKAEKRKLYEKLLLERDAVQKEAEEYRIAYTKLFGILMTAVYAKKVACIRKKKMIAYCQQKINVGEQIIDCLLEKFIRITMENYEKDLSDMERKAEEAEKKKEVSEETSQTIRKLYRDIAKKIHPDMHPELANNTKLRELWTRAVDAYKNNRPKDMKELETLVNLACEKAGQEIDFEIPDLDKKIRELKQEIRKIKAEEPYQYRFILEDPEAITKRRQMYEDELKEYTAYEKELDELLRKVWH